MASGYNMLEFINTNGLEIRDDAAVPKPQWASAFVFLTREGDHKQHFTGLSEYFKENDYEGQPLHTYGVEHSFFLRRTAQNTWILAGIKIFCTYSRDRSKWHPYSYKNESFSEDGADTLRIAYPTGDTNEILNKATDTKIYHHAAVHAAFESQEPIDLLILGRPGPKEPVEYAVRTRVTVIDPMTELRDHSLAYRVKLVAE